MDARTLPEDSIALRAELVAHARTLGLFRVGVATAGPVEHEHREALHRWLDARLYGSMRWLAEHAPVRCDPTREGMLPSARSVLVCAVSYHRGEGDPAALEGLVPFVARYARGRDYHNTHRRRLRKLARWLEQRVPGSRARPIVDTLPVLERYWAQRAGLGFVGKNGLLLTPGHGSYLLLGEVLTSVALPPDEPMETRCGSCTRCLDACPTQAFVRPFVLDAGRCVAYLTIEHQGPIDAALAPLVGEHLFGCDDCQSVCPYNRAPSEDPSRTTEFAPDSRLRALSLTALLELDADALATHTIGTPLHRPGRPGLARNAALVLGHRRDEGARESLVRSAAHDADEGVREAARWALSELDKGLAR